MIESVNVAGFRYAVKRIAGLEDFGGIDHESLLLIVKDNMMTDQENETILHEVLHALEVAYNFTIPEELVCKISRSIFAFLRDNPKFVKELL